MNHPLSLVTLRPLGGWMCRSKASERGKVINPSSRPQHFHTVDKKLCYIKDFSHLPFAATQNNSP